MKEKRENVAAFVHLDLFYLVLDTFIVVCLSNL